MASLPSELGRAKSKAKFSGLFSKSREVNVLSAARFFLFGARDIWFVVAVPVFLSSTLGWSFTGVGSFLALWVIGYGAVQSFAPGLIARWTGGHAPQGGAARVLAVLLAGATALIAVGLMLGASPVVVVLGGLGLFGVVFAINSSLHSYLILAYSDGDQVAMNVGFYYMSNAAGRLVGTLISGLMYEAGGLLGCLWASAAFALGAWALSLMLPHKETTQLMSQMKAEGGSWD
jgi:predicted MFS family arabinose efflux permease